jgi:hypothetical protein
MIAAPQLNHKMGPLLSRVNGFLCSATSAVSNLADLPIRNRERRLMEVSCWGILAPSNDREEAV